MMEVPGALDGERVDRVVSMLCDVTRAQASSLITDGMVRLGGRCVTTRSQRVARGDLLEVEAAAAVAPASPPAPDPAVEVHVVFEDDAVVVVDKQAGLVVHPGAGNPGSTLVNGLLARFPEMADVGDRMRPGIVHRLDAGTSGLMVVARTAAAYLSLVAQLGARSAERTYQALVWGHLGSPAGVVDAAIGRSPSNPTLMAVSAEGRPARTGYRVVGSFSRPDLDLLDCRLETGRTHQIRVHLAALGHPIVGDDRYGGARDGRVGAGRPFLHARELAFDHPVSGERAYFTSPLAPDLEAVLAELTPVERGHRR